jgi:hypothetical protein
MTRSKCGALSIPWFFFQLFARTITSFLPTLILCFYNGLVSGHSFNFTKDFALVQRQHVVVVRYFFIDDTGFEFVTHGFEEVSVNTHALIIKITIKSHDIMGARPSQNTELIGIFNAR